MKILFQINVVANWGSTGRIAEEIGEIAISKGWKSYIAFARNQNKSSSILIKVGTNWELLLHFLKTRLFDRHGLGSTKATIALVKKIEIIKPDIIHLHNIHGYYLNYKILFEYLSQTTTPVVWTLHDCWSFTGHCAYYDFIKCQKWKTQCKNCISLKSYPSSWGIDHSAENYLLKKRLFTNIPNLTLVPVSNWLACDVQCSFFKKNVLKVIHNGIDIDVFQILPSRKKTYMTEDKMMILGVASIWSQRKGLRDFIKLADILPKDCIIVLLGLSLKQIKDLPNNIIGITRIENVHQLVELYSSADVFVNPTWQDNFPTTNLEALACGTPVVTYRTGGSIEAITPETGFIVEQGDVNELLSVIQLIKNKDKGFYTNACRNRAEEFYNKKERYAEYIQLYKKLLNKNGNVII